MIRSLGWRANGKKLLERASISVIFGIQESMYSTAIISLNTDSLSKGGEGLCNCEPNLATHSRFLEFNLCNIRNDYMIM